MKRIGFVICEYCDKNRIKVTEDEEHVLCICPLGNTIRNAFLDSVANSISNVTLPDLTSSSNGTPSVIAMTCHDMARTYPVDLNSDNQLADSLKNLRTTLIRISCRHIHRLYRNTLHHKKELEAAAASVNS